MSAPLASSAAPTCVPSFDDCATPADEDCDGKTPACDGAESWSRRFVGGGDARITSIVHSKSGAHWVAGIFQNSLALSDALSLQSSDSSPGAGRQDAFADHDSFVARIDEAGAPTQVTQLGGPGDQTVAELALDADENAYVVGTLTKGLVVAGTSLSEGKHYLNHTGFVASFDAKGKPRWYDATSGMDYGASFTHDAVSNSSLWILGYTSGFSRSDPFVRRLDLDGKQTFEWRFEGQFDSVGLSDIVSDEAGGVVLLGNYDRHLAFAGKDVLPPVSPGASASGFAVAFDSTGSILWAKSLGPLHPQHGALDSKRRLYVTGIVADDESKRRGLDPKNGYGFLIGLDENHQERFFRQTNGRDMGDRATGVYYKAAQWFTESWANGTLVDTDPAGNVIVLEGFAGTFHWGDEQVKSSHLRDAMLIKLAPDGTELWKKLVSGPQQPPHTLAVDAKGDAWVGGIFVDKADGLLARHAP